MGTVCDLCGEPTRLIPRLYLFNLRKYVAQRKPADRLCAKCFKKARLVAEP